MIVAFCGVYSRMAASISFSTIFCKLRSMRQMHLITVPRRSFLPAIKHHLLPGAVVFDVTVTILAVEIFFHR